MPMRLLSEVSVDEVVRTWTIMQDFVLIEDFGTPEFAVGSMISIAGSRVQPDARFGKVLLTGPGIDRWSKTLKKYIHVPMDVKPGDFLIYFKHHGTHTTYKTKEGLNLRLLDQRSQILGIITEPPNEMKSMQEYEDHLRKNAFFPMQA